MPAPSLSFPFLLLLQFDLLDKLLEEHIGELRKLCDAAGAEAEYEDIALLWFEYLERHYGFFSAMLASKGSSFFRNRFLTFFLEELDKAENVSPEGSHSELTDGEKIDLQFLGAAIVGIVEWWFKNDKPVPPVFMAKRVGMLLERNLEHELPSV